MSHKQWFTDAVTSLKLPPDPTTAAKRKMLEIGTVLAEMATAFNETSEELALGLRFDSDAAGIKVESPTLGPRVVRSVADVDDIDLTRPNNRDVQLVRFWADGPHVFCEVHSDGDRRPQQLGDRNPADIIKAQVEHFLRDENVRRQRRKRPARVEPDGIRAESQATWKP